MSNLISLSQQSSSLRSLYLFHGAGLGSRVGFSQAAPILHINEVLKGMFVCKTYVDDPTYRLSCWQSIETICTDVTGSPNVLGTIVRIARANGRDSLWFFHTLILASSFFLHEFSKF